MKMFPMVKASLSDSVKVHLYQYIKSMDLKQGTKLPSENVIAENLSVSRVTIRRALDDLEKEGAVFRIHGKGTFVNPEALQIKINLLPGGEFHQIIKDSGYEARFEIKRFEVIEADAKLAQVLQIGEGDGVYLVEKLYYADNHPAIISIDRFPTSLFSQELEEKDSKEQSVFDILRFKGGCVVTRDKVEIETMNTKRMSYFSTSAEMMECDSVLVFHGINYDQNNRPVIFDTEFYNTNYIRFNLLRVKEVFAE